MLPSHINSRKLMEQQLIISLENGLPPSVRLVAYNFSRAGTSLYALLCRKQKNESYEWLTLRLTDHYLWLTAAQQVTIDFGNPADLIQLTSKIENLFKKPKIKTYFYTITSRETAVLQFLDACQKNNMIWAVRLSKEIFAARKQLPLNLKSDFMRADLFLGDRNNLNKLLLPIEAKKYQAELATLFGRNLLFSQFSRGRLLRLLPTNQWIQPIIQHTNRSNLDWKKQIVNEYGQHLIDIYEKGKKV